MSDIYYTVYSNREFAVHSDRQYSVHHDVIG